MLRVLELRDFALIDELALELRPGLNALTGETGAGKSIIVDALSQLAGARADPGFVRSGSTSALIQGEFESTSGTQTLGRKLQAEGRSSARINGELVTVAELAEAARQLIGVHAQHASHELADPARHIRLLDRITGEAGASLLTAYRLVHTEWVRSRDRLARLKETARERAQRLDTISRQLEEIKGARLVQGEEEELRARLGALRNSEAITEGVSAAVDLLLEAEPSAVSSLVAAHRALQGAARHSDEVATLMAELVSSLESVQATAAELDAFLAGFDTDPGLLEKAESRLARIESLRRKYGEDIEAILEHAAALQGERDELAGLDDDISTLEADLIDLRTQVDAKAAQLSSVRRAAAEGLDREILPLLADLGMREARFGTDFRVLQQPGPSGTDRVQFVFSANAGEPLADLALIASGGELSRLLLALHLLVGAEQPVLVFDEVDAGTGGQAAVSIGALLKRLAAGRQVLVVTHLPQVAAWADTQYHVSKQELGGRTLTRVTLLEGEARVDEIARMLAGAVTDNSRRAARELLARSSEAHSTSASAYTE